MTVEVILHKMKYLRIHNVSTHIKFYHNRFINECVRKTFLKFVRIFLGDVEELTFLIIIFNISNLTCDSFSAVLSAELSPLPLEAEISAEVLPLPLQAAMSTKLFPSPLEIVMSVELFPFSLEIEIVSFVDVRKSFDTVISGD